MRPKAGSGLAAPTLAEGEQAIELVEMHAVAVRQVERGEPADRLPASGALPLRDPSAVATVPFIHQLAPGEASGSAFRPSA